MTVLAKRVGRSFGQGKCYYEPATPFENCCPDQKVLETPEKGVVSELVKPMHYLTDAIAPRHQMVHSTRRGADRGGRGAAASVVSS